MRAGCRAAILLVHQMEAGYIITCSLWPIIWEIVEFSRKPPRYYHMSRYPLFMVPWYYRTFPRYYHMCRYPLSYHSAVLSYEPVSSLLRFRGIIGHFRGIITCAAIFFLIIFTCAGIFSFRLP